MLKQTVNEMSKKLIAKDLGESPWYRKQKNFDWPYISTRLVRYDLPFDFKLGKDDRIVFKSMDREPLGVLNHDNRLFIHAGYAFDGATCAPDFKSGMAAYFIHDFMYQMLRHSACPWTKAQADQMLKLVGDEFGFKLSGVYFHAVSIFGSMFMKSSTVHGVGDDIIIKKVKSNEV